MSIAMKLTSPAIASVAFNSSNILKNFINSRAVRGELTFRLSVTRPSNYEIRVADRQVRPKRMLDCRSLSLVHIVLPSTRYSRQLPRSIKAILLIFLDYRFKDIHRRRD